MKILIGNYPPPYSGQSVAFQTLVDGLKEKKIPIRVINTVEIGNRRNKLYRVVTYFKVLFQLIYFLLFYKVKVVYHILSSSRLGFLRDFLIINLAVVFKKRVILHSHNGNYDVFYRSQHRLFRGLIKLTINKAHTIVLLSAKLKYTFFFITDSKKFRFVRNGLSISKETSEPKMSAKKIHILYLSNLIEAKGYLDLLKAAVYLKDKRSINKFHFHFAGDFMLNPEQDRSFKTLNEAKANFFEIIAANELQQFVSYYGVLKGSEKVALLRQAELFVLPTYYNVEAQPLTIIEAMAFGLPIYSTAYRGIEEMIIPHKNGCFILPENPADIADKIEGMSIAELRKMGEYSFEIYKKYFSREAHVQNMLRVLEEVESE